MERRVAAIAAAATLTAAAAVATAVLLLRRSSCDEAERVLAFWFDGNQDELYERRWFVAAGSAAQAALDGEVAASFGSLLERARRGELDHWRRTPRGALALIVLLDQLGRHAYRGQRALVAEADAIALLVCTDLFERGWDAQLGAAQLVFALMPWRHQPTEPRLEQALSRAEARLCVDPEGCNPPAFKPTPWHRLKLKL